MPLLLLLGLATGLPHAAATGTQAPFAVVDLHVDLPYQITYKSKTPGGGNGRYVAKWLWSSGVRAAVLPLYVPREVHPDGPQMSDLKHVLSTASEALSRVRPWRTTNRVNEACAVLNGQHEAVAAFYSFEGATPLGFELRSVEDWAKRVRLFGLVHSYDTPVVSSSGYQFRKPGYGLTRRGQELVRRIHAYGGVVDVSHASDEAIADVLTLSAAQSAIVVATHSNARAVAAHPRNLTDAQIRAIAHTGGVIGVAFHAPFLTTQREATLDDVVRHILHIRRIAGIRAVAIGSDFEGGIRPPPELSDVRGFPRLAQALRKAGLNSAEVRQVFGQNARRVLCGG